MKPGDWVTLVVGIAAAVIAVVAAWISWRQAQASRAANEEAARQTEAAREANRLATLALEETRKANRISKQAADQARERNVVDLGWKWLPAGRVKVTNRGEGTALDLEGYLEINGEEKRVQLGSLGPGESFEVEFPGARKAVVRRRQDRRAAQQEARRKERERQEQSQFFSAAHYSPIAGVHDYDFPTDVLSGRLSWKSPAGVTDRWETSREFFHLDSET